MHRLMTRSLGLLLVAVAATLASAQNSTRVRPNCGNCGPGTRQPYTAEFKTTSVQTLANGTTITRESTEIEALDSQGRQLFSTTELTPTAGRAAGTSTRVNDPAGSIQSDWDSRSRKAHLIKLPPQDQQDGCWTNDSGNLTITYHQGSRPAKPAPNGTALPDGSTIVPAQRHTPQVEDLGRSTIQGVEAQGRRTTITIPQGAIGNDQPLVAVSEIWTSRELGLILREIHDDPRSGKLTKEAISLNLGEPDPSLFQPPDGYEVTTDELHQVACRPPR